MRFKVGDIEIQSIVEMEGTFLPPEKMFGDEIGAAFLQNSFCLMRIDYNADCHGLDRSLFAYPVGVGYLEAWRALRAFSKRLARIVRTESRRTANAAGGAINHVDAAYSQFARQND